MSLTVKVEVPDASGDGSGLVLEQDGDGVKVRVRDKNGRLNRLAVTVRREDVIGGVAMVSSAAGWDPIEDDGAGTDSPRVAPGARARSGAEGA